MRRTALGIRTVWYGCRYQTRQVITKLTSNTPCVGCSKLPTQRSHLIPYRTSRAAGIPPKELAAEWNFINLCHDCHLLYDGQRERWLYDTHRKTLGRGAFEADKQLFERYRMELLTRVAPQLAQAKAKHENLLGRIVEKRISIGQKYEGVIISSFNVKNIKRGYIDMSCFVRSRRKKKPHLPSSEHTSKKCS